MSAIADPRRVPVVVTALRRIPVAPPSQSDIVLGIAVLHPDEQSADELVTVAEWRDRSDAAIAAFAAYNHAIRRHLGEPR